MMVFVIIAVLFLMRTSEASLFNSSLNDQEYVSKCSATILKVCMACDTVGTCTKSGSTYVVTPSLSCIGNDQCYKAEGADAMCALVRQPECTCTDANIKCKPDPNDKLSYIDCSNMQAPSYRNCKPTEEVDLMKCTCVDKCQKLKCYSNSATDCKSYVECDSTTGGSTQMNCNANSCFNKGNCQCDLPSCPECGIRPDPDNPPSGYIKCGDGSNTKGDCLGQVFDSTTCQCGSTTDPCAKCGYYAYTGDTTKYYKCVSGGTAILSYCPTGFYFNPDTCYCEGTPPITTSTPKTTTKSSDPCAKCGYYEYPGDNTKYYKCLSGGGTAVANCPTGFTFNPNTCYCE